jgi:hypothetical protein
MSEKIRGNDAVENAAFGLLRASAQMVEAIAKGSRDLYEKCAIWAIPSEKP